MHGRSSTPRRWPIDDWAFTKKDYFRDPAALPNLESLPANIGLQQKLGFLRTWIGVKKHADLGIAQKAAQRLPATQQDR